MTAINDVDDFGALDPFFQIESRDVRRWSAPRISTSREYGIAESFSYQARGSRLASCERSSIARIGQALHDLFVRRSCFVTREYRSEVATSSSQDRAQSLDSDDATWNMIASGGAARASGKSSITLPTCGSAFARSYAS